MSWWRQIRKLVFTRKSLERKNEKGVSHRGNPQAGRVSPKVGISG